MTVDTNFETMHATRRKIEPEHLGPLGGEPMHQATPPELFPGEEKFLSRGQRKRRLKLWQSVAPLLERLLAPDERVLYFAQGTLRPSTLQSMALGWMSYRFQQVALVFTGTRLVEILLDFKGNFTRDRIRSFYWSQVERMKIGSAFGSLVLKPRSGKKKFVWMLGVRGDRKLLKLLVPRIQERLHADPTSPAPGFPVWHCPECLTGAPARPAGCATCGTIFRSGKLAAVLALAFPGAGMMYAGYPALAGLGFLGEAFIFGVVVFALATSSSADSGASLGVAIALFVAMKFHCLHVREMVGERARPDTPERRSRWKKFAAAGSVVSVLAIAGALAMAGRFAPAVDRDLEFPSAERNSSVEWRGTRKAAEWKFFAANPSMRSQWTHRDGWMVFVLAYPMSAGETPEGFRGDFVKQMESQGHKTLAEDDSLPEPFRGFRHVSEFRDDQGNQLTSIDYFVYDAQGRDIHHLLTVAGAQDAEKAEAHLRDLLSHGRWVDAVVPVR